MKFVDFNVNLFGNLTLLMADLIETVKLHYFICLKIWVLVYFIIHTQIMNDNKCDYLKVFCLFLIL